MLSLTHLIIIYFCALQKNENWEAIAIANSNFAEQVISNPENQR